MGAERRTNKKISSNLIINTLGYIKEPAGIDFTVDPTPLTNEDDQTYIQSFSCQYQTLVHLIDVFHSWNTN
jgi:hypothetical protein